MLALLHFVVNKKLRSEEAFMGRCLFFGIYDHSWQRFCARAPRGLAKPNFLW